MVPTMHRSEQSRTPPMIRRSWLLAVAATIVLVGACDPGGPEAPDSGAEVPVPDTIVDDRGVDDPVEAETSETPAIIEGPTAPEGGSAKLTVEGEDAGHYHDDEEPTGLSEEDDAAAHSEESAVLGPFHGEPGLVPGSSSASPYKNRHVNSLLPPTDQYYYNHAEIAKLFDFGSPYGECPPPRTYADVRVTLRDRFAEYDRIFRGWDTAWMRLEGGDRVLGGWSDHRRHGGFRGYVYGYGYGAHWHTMGPRGADWRLNDNGDYLTRHGRGIGGVGEPGSRDTETQGVGSYLQDRLRHIPGWTEVPDPQRPPVMHAISTGIIPHGRPNPGVDARMNLLWDWTEFRYSQPPVDREPSAWAAWTLLSSYDFHCLGERLHNICGYLEPPESPHLRNDAEASELGLAIWSIVCGQGPRT